MLGKFFPELLFLFYLCDVGLPFMVVERRLLGWSLARHAFLVKRHVHRVDHQAWSAEDRRTCTRVPLNTANFNKHV